MNSEDTAGILIEAIEVFLQQILYLRDVYPAQIFKKRGVYNTPVFVSIYPPLNLYLNKVLLTARELQRSGELQCVELILYRNEMHIYERYKFYLSDLTAIMAPNNNNDEFLLDFEEQLRTSLYKIAERMKPLEKLPKDDVKFKVLLHTTQVGFVRLSHNSQYQDFPWLHESLRDEPDKKQISLLPLTTLKTIGLQLIAEIV